MFCERRNGLRFGSVAHSNARNVAAGRLQYDLSLNCEAKADDLARTKYPGRDWSKHISRNDIITNLSIRRHTIEAHQMLSCAICTCKAGYMYKFPYPNLFSCRPPPTKSSSVVLQRLARDQ
jgi:hypothetical protein